MNKADYCRVWSNFVGNFTHDPSKHKFFVLEQPLTSVNAS